jgi:bla regulator protein blaR1
MEYLLIENSVRASAIAVVVAVMLRLAGIRTAALKHAAWVAVMVAMLILPAVVQWGPKVSLRILPRQDLLALNISQGSEVGPSRSIQEGGPVEKRVAPTQAVINRAWDRWVAGVYLLGLISLLARLAIGTWQVKRLVRSARLVNGKLTHPGCSAPVAVGWLRPRVVYPPEWPSWMPAHLTAVELHEAEHVRRRDPLIQWVALLNRAIFWFNPLAWWLERRISELAEEATDDAVIRRGTVAGEYAELLLAIARRVHCSGGRVPALGLTIPGRGLQHRILRILAQTAQPPPVSPLRIAGVTIACLTITTTIAGMQLAREASPAAFETVSIRPHTGSDFGVTFGPGRVEFIGTPILKLISEAYQIPDTRIAFSDSGSREFILMRNMYTVIGQAAYPETKERLLLMLQQLLEERFQLRSHRESRMEQGYDLVTAPGGGKFRESITPDGSSIKPTREGIEFHGARMPEFSTFLTRLLGRPVTDRTTLTGSYDFTIYFAGIDPNRAGLWRMALRDWAATSLVSDLPGQLGLELKSAESALGYLVVDHIEQPSAN